MWQMDLSYTWHSTRNAGGVVTRDTIRESIWHDRTIEFDHGINACIRDIRRVLGDNSKEPQFIETLPKVGYRFIGALSPAKKNIVFVRRFWCAALFTFAIMAAAVLWSLSQSVPRDADVTGGQGRIAVMPFQGAFLEEGDAEHIQQMTVSVATALAEKQDAMHVVSAAELFAEAAQQPGMGDVSHWLKVDYLVAGTLSRDSNILALNLRLIRTDGYVHLWSQSLPLGNARDIEQINHLTSELLAALAAIPHQ